MIYRHLGETGLELSTLTLGGANFGSGSRPGEDWPWTIDDAEQSRALIDRALELGINSFDTANIYSTGESEEVLCEALDNHRSDIVIASKVGGVMAHGQNQSGLSRSHVLEALEGTLNRLDTDYLDLYYCHRYDERTSPRELVETFTGLIRSGKIRHWGISNFPNWVASQCIAIAERHGFSRPSLVQAEYSLLARHEEQNSLPLANQHNLGLLTFSPLGAGFLTGSLQRSDIPDDSTQLGYDETLWSHLNNESCWEVLERVRELATDHDCSPAQISIAWVLAQEMVNSVIIGPRTVDELEDSVNALSINLDDDELMYLEEPIKPVWSNRYLRF